MKSFIARCLTAALAATAVVALMPSAQAAEKVSLCYISADAAYGPWWYAQDKGFFTKNGLDTTLNFFDSGTKGAQAQVGGQVDICAADGNSVINADMAGADLRFIGATIGVLSGNIYFAKDIKSPAELKGKKWAISSFGSEANVAALVALKHFGLTDKDVSLVQLGNQGNRLAALEANQVSATSLLPPVSVKAEGLGYKMQAKLPELAPDYASVGAVVSLKYMQAHKANVVAVIKSLAQATAALKKDSTGGAGVIEKYLKADPKDAAIAWAYYAPLYSSDLTVTDKSVQFLIDESTDPKTKAKKPSDFIDLSIVKELQSQGFFKTLQ